MRENKEYLTRRSLLDWLEKIEGLENRLEKLEDWVGYLKSKSGDFQRAIDRLEED